MRRISLLCLSLLLPLAACVTSSVGAEATSAADLEAPAEDPAPSAAWLTAMDRGSFEVGPGSLEVDGLDGLDEDADSRATGEPQQLELAALRVDARTVGTMAAYEIEHVFVNPADAVLEGTFRFPLPSGAIVTGLAMEIDGALIEGEILERNRAREIYEEIVDSMRDPALLEWEAGQVFKLRVFPIQPGERKRVIMRYMAPLVPSDQAPSGLALVVPTAAPAMQEAIPSLQVRVDGQEVLAARDHDVRDNLSVPLARASTPAYVQELHESGRYLAARLDLDWSVVPQPIVDADRPRRTVIVVDSSRSALESWPLARESVATILDSLAPGEAFTVLAADLHARSFDGGEGFVANDPGSRKAALDFLQTIEPDGASDLSAALTQVGRLLADATDSDSDTDTRVIYIGDGTPTWGPTDAPTLRALTQQALGDAALYAVSVGKRESRDTLEALTGTTGGRTIRPQTIAQVQAFSRFLERAPTVRRLAAVTVDVPGLEGEGEGEGDGVQLHEPVNTTWFEGERPTIDLRLAADQPVPRQIRVRGWAGGEAFEQVIDLGEPVAQVGVRQQWAARELQRTDDKTAAVALSVEHSVLSKHTALLVLESEEAYERYAIERRNARAQAQAQQAQGDPRITGRDLDGDGSDPYLGPGDLQPGDPEIYIPAPRDAQSVEVVFPFGESKAARWEEALGQWTVRFLVDDDTAPGTYQVLVRITHADGHVEILHLDYTIDVEAPQLSLELRPRSDGGYDVYAHQVLTQADAARERAEGLVEAGAAETAETLDARRVELLMPDGQTLSLRRGTQGHFVRRWQPRGELRWPATVTAVITDRALNNRRVELSLDLPAETQERR